MYIKVLNTNKNVILSNDVFKQIFKNSLVHQVVTSIQNNKRKGNSCQKSRSEVTGSKKKPWRQKGTGKARSGSVKSPIWRSGGVAFASKPKKYYSKINKKVYKLALKMVLSKLLNNSNLFVVNDICIQKPKTKIFINNFKFINKFKCLIIVNNIDKNLFLSSRNLYNFKVCNINHINIIDLVTFRSVVFTIESIKSIESRLINEDNKL